jgi:Dolichyl-phosphate-mannose-protein mannosyltransferase
VAPSTVRRTRWRLFAEALLVGMSPVIAFFGLRIRAMAPTGLPDPSMHTIYIVDPRDVFVRYSAVYPATDRLREAARVGFLVPARLDYLVFGAVPGFFVTRYLLALIAVVPTYVLLRRLYNPVAGIIGILAILASPVVITAWGTDYPDSAVVSYMAGALACLAMPCGDRERRIWVVAASVLLTMAVWAHSVSVPLVIATLAVYGLIRAIRARSHLVTDVALLGAAAIIVTGGLSLLSGILIGQYNFFTPTWEAYRYLSLPAQVASWHAKGWRWLAYLPYLLVPPAVIGAWFVVFVRRLREIPTAQLFIGAACAAQTALFAYLQFFGSVETLEEHYFSSTLWGSVCLTLAVTVAEAARPFWEGAPASRTRWIPAVLVLAVPLLYEAAPREPAYKWVGTGLFLALLVVVGAVVTRLTVSVPNRWISLLSIGIGIALATSSVLYLSADPVLRDPYLDWVKDPAPAYSTALGSNAGDLVDIYRVSAELPSFVGNATYKGEQLLMWWPPSEVGTLISPTGMYHFVFNSLPSGPPVLTGSDVAMLEQRRPAELLLLNTSGGSPAASLKALSSFEPRLLRSAVLHSGSVDLYVWLINLKVFGPAR